MFKEKCLRKNVISYKLTCRIYCTVGAKIPLILQFNLIPPAYQRVQVSDLEWYWSRLSVPGLSPVRVIICSVFLSEETVTSQWFSHTRM